MSKPDAVDAIMQVVQDFVDAERLKTWNMLKDVTSSGKTKQDYLFRDISIVRKTQTQLV